ncbi:MAG: ABC transporter ATP-binding protein [Phycisphaerae bacterium]
MNSKWSDLKRFARVYVRPRWKMFTFVQCLHVIAVILVLIPPLLIRYGIDDAIPAKNFTGLAIASGVLVLIFVLFTFIHYLKTYWGHEVAQRITSRLRDDLYSHCQKLSMSFHDRRKTGGMLSRIVDDINVIQEVVHHGPEVFVLAVVMISGCAALMFYFSWKLALAALVFLPLLVWHVRRTGLRMWEEFRHVRKKKESLSDLLEENFNGIAIIKAFIAEPRESENVREENEHHYNSRMGVIRYMSRMFPGAALINALAMGVVLLYGGYLTMAEAISIGTLAAFFFYLQRFLQPIVRAVMMLEHAGQFFASIERFHEYMDISPDIRDHDGSEDLKDCAGEVTFENVEFSYDHQRPILKDVSLHADPGQMIALVGPSGAGKTTVIRMIPRFYEPQQGRVLVDGRDIRDITLRSLRSHIGIVMQDDFLFSGSVAENISYGRPDATGEEVIEAARMANADAFVQELPEKYDTPIGKRGLTLSEGQRQRLSIARALLKNPQILLLDEATSSVDPETELLIQNAVDRLKSGRTTFAIAHRLSTIFQADQILFVNDGRIIEHGTHQELLDADGEYARFFDIQFRKLQRPETPTA